MAGVRKFKRKYLIRINISIILNAVINISSADMFSEAVSLIYVTVLIKWQFLISTTNLYEVNGHILTHISHLSEWE
jgi:hypothetical protein